MDDVRMEGGAVRTSGISTKVHKDNGARATGELERLSSTLAHVQDRLMNLKLRSGNMADRLLGPVPRGADDRDGIADEPYSLVSTLQLQARALVETCDEIAGEIERLETLV